MNIRVTVMVSNVEVCIPLEIQAEELHSQLKRLPTQIVRVEFLDPMPDIDARNECFEAISQVMSP